MRALALLAGVAALVGMAIPAHADSDDDAFLAALNKAGITYPDPARAIRAGQKVCDLAGSGTTELDIIRDVHELNPAFSTAKAALFVQAAAGSTVPSGCRSATAARTRTAIARAVRTATPARPAVRYTAPVFSNGNSVNSVTPAMSRDTRTDAFPPPENRSDHVVIAVQETVSS